MPLLSLHIYGHLVGALLPMYLSIMGIPGSIKLSPYGLHSFIWSYNHTYIKEDVANDTFPRPMISSKSW
nr:hypothetical protein Q903MT_gene6482 [Picea sitchensis]